MIILSDEKFELIANYKRKISKVDELKILDIIYKKTPNSCKHKRLVVFGKFINCYTRYQING
jgi:hypothetical protein